MAVYGCALESGPKRRKTMVHVPSLFGCVANGPTTDAALAATPHAISAFRRLMRRAREDVSADDAVELRIDEHITDGKMLGDGSPYISFSFDAAPLLPEERDLALGRLSAMTELLADWTDHREARSETAAPTGARTDREILLHIIGAQGASLAYALGSARGYGPIRTRAEKGDLPMAVALREAMALTGTILRGASAEQRAAVRELPSGRYTLRKAVRHLLEHEWEHLRELNRRPHGPAI